MIADDKIKNNFMYLLMEFKFKIFTSQSLSPINPSKSQSGIGNNM